jgi:hypothetical protein
MVCSSTDHGIFVWTCNGETCYLALATDDILFLFKTHGPFLLLQKSLEKLFDLTVTEGSILNFLNLHIVQSPASISFNQSDHIRNTILHEYFANVPPSSIKMQPYPFPLDSFFEHHLFEAALLTGIDLTNGTKWFGFVIGHIVGGLMHIATISCPDDTSSSERMPG